MRIGIAGEFIGHAAFALQAKEGWIKYFTAVGFTPEAAVQVMPIIGVMDLILGIIVLVRPVKVLLIWMAAWGLLTAIGRPVGGDPIWDLVERGANWAAPLALYLYYKMVQENKK